MPLCFGILSQSRSRIWNMTTSASNMSSLLLLNSQRVRSSGQSRLLDLTFWSVNSQRRNAWTHRPRSRQMRAKRFRPDDDEFFAIGRGRHFDWLFWLHWGRLHCFVRGRFNARSEFGMRHQELNCTKSIRILPAKRALPSFVSVSILNNTYRSVAKAIRARMCWFFGVGIMTSHVLHNVTLAFARPI